MKIEKVEYKKLFNLGEFEHEEIGYVATVEPNETGDQILAKLVGFVETAHKAINVLKGMNHRVDRIYASWQDQGRTSLPADSIECQEEGVKREKHRIAQLIKQRKEVIRKETKQEYTNAIQSSEEYICEHEQKIKELKKEGEELTRKLMEYRKMFHVGDFSFLSKGAS